MAGGLSKRRLRLKLDADHDIPSSVHKVLSSDDLLMEILIRLPIYSLNLFTPVCKQWLSLITSPTFTLTRTRIPTVDPPSGLFIKQFSKNSRKHVYDFVSFDPRTPGKRSIEPLVRIKQIEQSCNGLLLCYMGGGKYSVCNPSISMFKMLPPIHDLNYVRDGQINFAFDPTKSPYYKVVHCGSVEDDVDDYEEVFRIQTYSSETGVWSVSDDIFSSDWFDDDDFSNGIYWNGALHWLSYCDVIKLDILDHPVLTEIQTTIPVTVRGDVHCDRKLIKSHDSLLLLFKDYDHLNIYEMKNEYSVWSVKYSVNLDDMMRPYPTWKMPTNWSCRRHMLSVVLGELDEDSFMVIELSGNILQYKFGLETVSELFYMEEPKIRRNLCFEYIASFAHV